MQRFSSSWSMRRNSGGMASMFSMQKSSLACLSQIDSHPSGSVMGNMRTGSTSRVLGALIVGENQHALAHCENRR